MSLLPDIIDWYGGSLNSLVMTILSNILRTKVLSFKREKRPLLLVVMNLFSKENNH